MQVVVDAAFGTGVGLLDAEVTALVVGLAALLAGVVTHRTVVSRP